MVRIIPWKLPDVAGGSVGGYTPRNEGEGGDIEPPKVFYDFSNVALEYALGGSSSRGLFIGLGTTYTGTKDVTKEFTLDSSYSLSLDNKIVGITPIDLVGVSQLVVKVDSEVTNGIYQNFVNSVSLSIDPITLVITSVISGTSEFTPTNAGFRDTTNLCIWDAYGSRTQSLSFTFYVYNSNGEIVQQSEEIVIA